MDGEVRRIDKVRTRVEVDTGPEGPIIGRGLEPLYVVGLDKRAAHDWAYRNKPGRALKFAHPDSPAPAQGLHLRDQTVYVMSPPSREAREAWLRTGARLVYL